MRRRFILQYKKVYTHITDINYILLIFNNFFIFYLSLLSKYQQKHMNKIIYREK